MTKATVPPPQLNPLSWWRWWVTPRTSDPAIRFYERNVRGMTALFVVIISLIFAYFVILPGTTNVMAGYEVYILATLGVLGIVGRLVSVGHIQLSAWILPFPGFFLAVVSLVSSGYWAPNAVLFLFIIPVISALVLRGNRARLIISVLVLLTYGTIAFYQEQTGFSSIFDASYSFSTAAGATFTFSWMFAVLVGSGGYLLSELVAQQEKLRRAAAELEDRVEERTRELAAAQAETEQALVKALEADQIKSQFLASMSHELRTPLNAILNFTRFNVMGLYGELNDRQHDSMNKIINSAQHLLELINDVLDITRIESDMLPLFIEENVSVPSVVHDVATAGQALLDGTGKDVRLETQIDPDIPPIVADQRRLRQVLLNLVSNACKFTEAGRIVIRGERDGDDLRLAVSDTGPGIAPDKLEVIFEPFQQSEAGIKHAGGTGLGLPIARRLVQAHHGDLWVETALGAGSTFYVRLPLRSPDLLALAEPKENPVHEMIEPSS